MISRFYFFILIISLSLAKIVDDSKLKQFMEYTKRYNKKYNSKEEFYKRFDIWKKNYNFIKRSNPYSFIEGTASQGAKYKLNQFSDMSQEEFASQYLTLDADMFRDLATVSAKDLGLDEVDPPEEFDWLEHGVRTAVKHQRKCGACYAFTATGALEAQYIIKGMGKNISFSPQQLIDCDDLGGKCKGGNMKKSFTYLLNHGLMLEEHYPYMNSAGRCRYDANRALIKVKEFKFLPKDEEEMKKALYKYGPLAGAVNGVITAFYDKGIIEPMYPGMCPPTINHAVLIVGYGVDKLTGKKFWKIKNSWGNKWGEEGYFRMIRGVEACGINTYTLIAEIEKFDKSKNYKKSKK